MKKIQTEIKVQLKAEDYFKNNPDYNILDMDFLRSYFNRSVTITSIDPETKNCLLKEIKGIKWNPSAFEKKKG